MRVAASRTWEMPPAGAGGSPPPRRALLLRLEDGEGRTGFGECSPVPGYSPDTFGEARQSLLAWLGGLPREIDQAEPVEAWMRAATPPNTLTPAARCCVETALLDLWGRRRGASISALFRGGEEAAPIPVHALLPRADAAAVLAAARKAVAAGFRTLKLKIGRRGAFAEELALCRALREQAGPEVRLRLDVNGGWTLEQAAERLRLLREIHPEFVEQPLPRGGLTPLSASPLPLAADESLQDPAEARRVFEAGVCSVAVLKPMTLGGLMRCLELARGARARGMGLVVTHSLGGLLDFAVSAELALALRPAPLTCGLALHPGLEGGPRPPQSRGTEITPSGAAGLGIAPPEPKP